MRDEIDERIKEALKAEDRALLDRFAEDPGLFNQLTHAFRGPGAGIAWIMYIAQFALFLAGVYLAWQSFRTEEVLTALHYGQGALFLLILGAIMKLALGVRGEVNRAIREVKRVELQMVMLKAENALTDRNRE